jgi:hypothetical protein
MDLLHAVARRVLDPKAQIAMGGQLVAGLTGECDHESSDPSGGLDGADHVRRLARP